MGCAVELVEHCSAIAIDNGSEESGRATPPTGRLQDEGTVLVAFDQVSQ
jgi:hypothetical protein